MTNSVVPMANPPTARARRARPARVGSRAAAVVAVVAVWAGVSVSVIVSSVAFGWA